MPQSAGYLACGDLRAAVRANFMALSAIEAGEVTDGVRERCAAQLATAQQIPDPRWREEVLRLNTLGWEPDTPMDVLDRVVADLGTGAGWFAAMSATQRLHIALRDGDLVTAADWLLHALLTYSRDQLYGILNAVKALCWLLVLRQEDALSYELRTAVNAIYRSRTGSDHREFLQAWTDGFAESRARLTDDELSHAEARGLALSFDELIERATEVAHACSSAQVDLGTLGHDEAGSR